ncbi:hypothetical protein PQ465_00320 [Sphingobacterium oryzagri]|uniref:Phosphatidate cytidylyltransferase n=1 Tax=Sphingobacterium oryzagri TaxID=3025669 RepID=A0ABY7WI38_9SPHI|nr:hypothetical protein [Sphingobacterium sp. KACC 22765]WDF68843.1 hypothetical protein PQ465_00320 [Sphingobacterium sp. KACC 22765]
MKKAIRYIIILLLFLVQALFLSAIFRENTRGYLIPIFILSVVILLCYSYLKRQLHEQAEEYESIKVVIWVPVGALCTYYLYQILALGPVLAASTIGAAASFIPDIRPKSAYLRQLPTAIYCGAFVGMCSPHVASGPGFVLVASLFTAIFLMVSKSVMQGIGGKLGTLAFIGVLITYLLHFYSK